MHFTGKILALKLSNFIPTPAKVYFREKGTSQNRNPISQTTKSTSGIIVLDHHAKVIKINLNAHFSIPDL